MGHFHLIWDVPIFWWHAWGAVVYRLIEVLGVLGLVFASCVVVTRYIENRRKRKTHAEALDASKDYFKDNVGTPLKAYLVLFLVLGFAIGPYELHNQDMSSIADRDCLSQQVHHLQDQLELARNNVSVSSPAANNLMYMMQAFRSYRGMLGGYMPIPCQVRFTAPADSREIAGTLSEFSIQVTNCTTFGPMGTSESPDEEHDTLTGMVPGTIVFHSRREDKAAFALYGNLSNLLPLKGSYEIPKGSPPNFIWLQFGSGVKWNSELLRQPVRPQ